MKTARLIVPTLAILLQLGAAILALGLPQWQPGIEFLVAYPTGIRSNSAAQLLIWGLIGIGILWTIFRALRELQLGSRRIRRRFWESSVLLVGMLVLLAGALRDLTYQVPMAGGSVAEAGQALEATYLNGR
ncbi:MAG: hypothetical protein ACREN8_02325 [Candidatus Dormibacteraceae bacterium]